MTELLNELQEVNEGLVREVLAQRDECRRLRRHLARFEAEIQLGHGVKRPWDPDYPQGPRPFPDQELLRRLPE